MNRRLRFASLSIAVGLSLGWSAAARADEPSTAPATTGVSAKDAQEKEKTVVVELAADDGRATIERRVSTTSPSGLPLVETGIFSVGQWEHACVSPCQVKLDPKYAYRVAGDGLVPTDSFALRPGGSERVRVDAKMGSSSGRVAGMLTTGAGLFWMAAGGAALIATPILESEEAGSKGFRTAVFAGGVTALSAGVIATGVGLYLWLTNSSSARASQVASAAPVGPTR